MKKVTVVYKDMDVDPTETIKYDTAVADLDDVIHVLNVAARKLQNKGVENDGKDAGEVY